MIEVEEELSPAVIAARAKLRERCATTQQLGGKGTARRKGRKTHKSVLGDEKKLQLTLKRLGSTSIFGVEELFMLRADGSALRFATPKVQAVPTANTYVVAGTPEEKANATSLLGLRGLLGGGGAAGGGGGGAAGMEAAAAGINPEVLKQLQQQVESLSKKGKPTDGSGAAAAAAEAEEEDVPDLVENFEEASKQ